MASLRKHSRRSWVASQLRPIAQSPGEASVLAAAGLVLLGALYTGTVGDGVQSQITNSGVGKAIIAEQVASGGSVSKEPPSAILTPTATPTVDSVDSEPAPPLKPAPKTSTHTPDGNGKHDNAANAPKQSPTTKPSSGPTTAPTPSPSPTESPAPTPAPSPTETPRPTPSPSDTPTPQPSTTPSQPQPTATPTATSPSGNTQEKPQRGKPDANNNSDSARSDRSNVSEVQSADGNG